MSSKTILKTAERRGLNAIAITDHNTTAGGVETFRLSKEKKSTVAVIIGAEIKTNIGDIIGLFLNHEIASNNIFEVIAEIRKQDGLVLVPHPFKGHKFEELREIINQVDLLEVLNSRSPITLEQNRLLRTINKPLAGCSDAHFPQEIGLCRSIFDSCALEIDDIKKMICHPLNITAIGIYGSSSFQRFSQVCKLVKVRHL
jgi:predicted metal-dependent phosphoesterase TrpH